ncbi:hypothetical protein D6D13_02393 [Aureobasidium pullulans]|uniref:Uncharacterized protein n=1 Tax=Aureobasidium pullulans TaxID=5580 RepID=A0A4S9D4L4_AURPU|nr:hypothetical protein D6D13_02393 [Aureobasidium pullulans]
MSPTLSLLGISCFMPLTALATNRFEKRATCSTFDTDGKSYTRPGPSPFTISAGIVCTGSSPCDIPVGGFVTVDRSLNISSLDDGTVSDIFALISSSDTSVTFEESTTNNISSTTQRFENGTAGYVIFTPTLRCISGTLGGCPSGNAAVMDGTIVEACTPTGSPQDPDDIVGSINIVKADEATAEALTCNPANVSSAAEAPNMACRSQKGGETSGTIRVSEVGSAFVTVSLIGIFALVAGFILRKRLTIVLSVEATSHNAQIMHLYIYECDRV